MVQEKDSQNTLNSTINASTIIGEKVIHKKWGFGTVVECRQGIITVAFEVGEKLFKYPAAFTRFLVFSNPSLQSAVLSLSEKPNPLPTQEKKNGIIPSKSSVNQRGIPIESSTVMISPTRHNDQGNNTRYSVWEVEYPNHVIIQKEGFMYTAHNDSASIMNEILGYKLITDVSGRVTTGGPNLSKIESAFEHANCSYIAVEDGVIVDRFDAV